jgi:hypothetical protein
MATATMPRAGADLNTIKLEYGIAQVFCLKFITGKSVPSQYPGGRVMFTAVDERRLFLNDEDANDLERGIQELGIRAGEDFVRVTKIKHPRGGGHSIRVERVPDENDEPAWVRESVREPARQTTAVARVAPATSATSATEALLEKSIEMARNGQRPGVSVPETVKLTPASVGMCAAMCAAVDAIIETQSYAQRRGLGVTFSEESVRAIGLSIYIGEQRGGR